MPWYLAGLLEVGLSIVNSEAGLGLRLAVPPRGGGVSPPSTTNTMLSSASLPALASGLGAAQKLCGGVTALGSEGGRSDKGCQGEV